MKLFGDSDASLRMPSAIAGIASVAPSGYRRQVRFEMLLEQAGDVEPARDIPRVLDHALLGHIDVRTMITDEVTLPEIPEALGQGNFAPLMGWLAEHVHAQASSAGFEEIVERATGEPLNPAVFKAHLKARYLP